MAGRSWFYLFVLVISILIPSAYTGIPATLPWSRVQLSSMEIAYLSERLQTKEQMSLDDAVNTVIELENFYTLLKIDGDRMYSPSLMVDKAWHQHILHTKMYHAFSRRHFNIECLHHLPFWSGNAEEVDGLLSDPEESGSTFTYSSLVAIFGADHVNQTVWFTNEDEGSHRMTSNSRDNFWPF